MNATASNTPVLKQHPGIGRSLVAAFLQRPGSKVIACVRNPSHTTATSLNDLPRATNATLVLLALDCADPNAAITAIETLQKKHPNITSIDVVIPNAAIASNFGPTSTMPTGVLENHMQVNCYSVLQLFQATKPLLEKSKQNPRFLFIGAPISTITAMAETGRAPLGAYSVSKLAANFVVRKLHYENKWLIAFIVDPGYVIEPPPICRD